jgi:hypothetical protein
MKAEPLRWTLGLAATEYGLDRRTLSTRAKTSGEVPGLDGKFSTKQVAAIIYGDLAGEKLRKLRAEADLAEIERDALRKETISMAELGPLIDHIGMTTRGIILNSSMSEQEKQDVFTSLRGFAEAMESKDFKLPGKDQTAQDDAKTMGKPA